MRYHIVRVKPRLLFLSQCLPYPPHSGVANRTFNILCQLQREFDVHVLSFSRRNHQPNDESRLAAREGLRRFVTAVDDPIPIPSEAGLARRLWCHIRSSTSGRPYTYYEYFDRRFEALLVAALRDQRPALVHMDSLDLYRWLAYLRGERVAVTHHSIESDLLRLRARYLRPAALRPYLRYQAALMERVERHFSRLVGLNVMMSESDAERLRRLAPGARTITVGNGVNTDTLRPAPESEIVPGRVAFLGPTYMFPNRDGVEFFLAEIWSVIRRSEPSATFEIIGKMSDSDRERYSTLGGVLPRGYVADIRPYLGRAACSVVPIRVGGGTRLKILDAWAMGKAVVSTSVGCEGLYAVDGENILIRDEPAAFAGAVLAVLGDDRLRQRLGRAGRATVERSYSWEALGGVLRSAYRDLMAEAEGAAPLLHHAG